MIYALIIVTVINIIIAVKAFKTIVAPPVLFNLGFLLCFLGASNFSEEWDLNSFHLNTFLSLTIGISLFTFTSLITREKLSSRKYSNSKDTIQIHIPNKVLILYIIFLIGYNFVQFKVLQQITGFNDFTSVIVTVDYMKKFDETETFSLPLYIKIINKITLTLSFIIAYYGVKAILTPNIKISTKILYITIFILSIGSPILYGGRAGSIRIILVILFMYYFLSNEKNNWKFRIPLKIAIIILGAGFCTIALWSNISELLGRSSIDDKGYDAKYYAAIYCGAQVKNLDLYLNENRNLYHSKTFGYATLSSIYAKYTSSKNPENMKDILSFREYNGYPLGNVYTCFYFYIYDFGYIGIFLISIFSYFITKVWNIIRYHNNKNKYMYLYIYAMFCYPLLFSFFSEFFFTTVLSFDFISRLILWMIEYRLIKKLFSVKVEKTHQKAQIV